jgi:tetratricopeptide (TPR) repeat protein
VGIINRIRRVDERKEQYKTYVREGNNFVSSGNFESAVASYTKAIEMRIYGDQPDYNMHYKRGCAYEAMKEREKAAEDYKVFLLADDRELKASNLMEAISQFNIGMQQGRAKLCLSSQTLEKLLQTYNFEGDYSNKKLYDWGWPYKITKQTLKGNLYEANYRMGVIRLLQGKYEEAHEHLEQSISVNPQDAGPYFFRGITHVLQSYKGGFFGPSQSNRELSKRKALEDFEQVMDLSQEKLLTDRAAEWKKKVMAL